MKNLWLRLKGLAKLFYMNFLMGVESVIALVGVGAILVTGEMSYRYLPSVVDFDQLTFYGKALFWGAGGMAILGSFVVACLISCVLPSIVIKYMITWRMTKRYDADRLIYRTNLMEDVRSDMPRAEVNGLTVAVMFMSIGVIAAVATLLDSRINGAIWYFMEAKVFPVCWFGTLVILVAELVLIAFGWLASMNAIRRHNEPILRGQYWECER